MARLVSLFISERQQKTIGLLMGGAIFLSLMIAAGFFGVYQARQAMESEARRALQPYIQLRGNLLSTFDALERQVTAAPCTAEFNDQLRRVAFLPDGFHEFLYAPGGTVQCSASIAQFDPPLALGQPDLPSIDLRGDASVWIDRALAFSGLEGLVGSVILREPFAIVVPRVSQTIGATRWLDLETIFVGGEGAWWHRGGTSGVYKRYQSSVDERAAWFDASLRRKVCDEQGLACAVAETSILALLQHGKTFVIATILIAALLAATLAAQARAMIVRHWSFEARFRRLLDAESVVCSYQPIMELATGRITACEVLARWRDVDDTIVYPDRFIPLVEKYGLTLEFTRMVVERAFRELSAAMPVDYPLKVTFNVFPRDLDGVALCEIFRVFDAAPGRFQVIVELVESDAIVVDRAQRQIEHLRAAGITTYIDDFGTGYSSIHNLAELCVAGAKLDRAFAMAPPGSVMSRMLTHAVEMIHASGRSIVVEGVETAERLESLCRIRPAIDYVQGYYISRPLDIRGFVSFITRSTDRGRLPAAA